MTITRRSLLAATAIIPAAMSLAGAAHASPETARAFITELGRETMEILQSQDPVPRKAERMEGVLRRGFDFAAIGRFVLGRHWNTASPRQREEFLEAFTDFVSRSYSRRLAEEATVSGFDITNMRDLGEGDYLIQTEITRPSAPPLKYEWRVRQGDGGVKIVDVIVEGVSLIITHRSDFTSVVSRNGMDGLIQSLREKAAR